MRHDGPVYPMHALPMGRAEPQFFFCPARHNTAHEISGSCPCRPTARIDLVKWAVLCMTHWPPVVLNVLKINQNARL